MTGRIGLLATANTPGLITTNCGTNTYNYAYELAGGRNEGLALGRLVSFELEKGRPGVAVHVRPTTDDESSEEPLTVRREVRYEGFEQTNNIRSFKFHAWRTGEENERAIVTADLALFRKHGVGIQEGPGLCLRVLQVELQGPSRTEAGVWERALTDKEMLDHLASRGPVKKRM